MARRRDYAEVLDRHGLSDDPQFESLLHDLLAVGSKTRGRPRKPEDKYRRLLLRWTAFKRQRAGQFDTEEHAAATFLRKERAWLTSIGLSRKTYHSLRNASRRGVREHAKLRAKRRQQWRILPTLFGKRMLSTDALDRARYLHLLGYPVRGL